MVKEPKLVAALLKTGSIWKRSSFVPAVPPAKLPWMELARAAALSAGSPTHPRSGRGVDVRAFSRRIKHRRSGCIHECGSRNAPVDVRVTEPGITEGRLQR